MRSPLAALLRSRRRFLRVLALVTVVLAGAGTATAMALLGPERDAATTAAPPTPAPLPVLGPPTPTSPLAAPTPATAPAPPVRRAGRTKARSGGRSRAYYRRIAARRVAASDGTSFVPLYREAERTFGVAWQLIASVHRQETAFSTVPGTYEGLNAFGCCGGPMQFNVTNGPVSTWDAYKQSFRLGERPARYPHRTRKHPSLYDDFDAIMAAGALLRDGGATRRLDGGSWLAAYGYYGRDLFGITYASQVLGRAQAWAQKGFCPACADDPARVAALDDAFGVNARRELLAAESRAKAEKARARRAARARKARKERAAAKRERAAVAKEEASRPTTPKPAPARTPAKPAPAEKAPAPAAGTSSTPAPAAPQTAPAPATGQPTPPPAEPAAPCTNVAGLGC